MKEKSAKVIRVLTAPPVMALWLILMVNIFNHGVFQRSADTWLAILGLVVIPSMAYPIQRLIKSNSADLRKKERRLAFILNIFGYLGFFIYCLIVQANKELMLISASYLFAVVVLSILNKTTPYRASGHACCVCAPLVLIIKLISWKWILLSFLIGGLMVWASLYLKRHTVKELALGFLSYIIAFTLALIVF